jgi:Uma2 family endonuclease
MTDVMTLPSSSITLDIPPLMTAEEFDAAYPDETTESIQLLDGQVTVATPTPLHQAISARLLTYLNRVILSNDLGELQSAPSDVYFDTYNVVQPDLFFVAKGSPHCAIGSNNRWHGAPDLCIEILSPTSSKHDRQTKFDLYERHSVREYWIVSPQERTLEVYGLVEGHYQRLGVYDSNDSFSGRVLPDLTLRLADLFPTNGF